MGLLLGLVGRCMAGSPIDMIIGTDRLINSTYLPGKMRAGEVPGGYWVNLALNNFVIRAQVSSD